MVRGSPAAYTSCASAVADTTFHSGMICAGLSAVPRMQPLISTTRFR